MTIFKKFKSVLFLINGNFNPDPGINLLEPRRDTLFSPTKWGWSTYPYALTS